jgi:hypothetical protein
MDVFEIEYWIIHLNGRLSHKTQDRVAENEEQALQYFINQEASRDNLDGSWLVNSPFIRHKYKISCFGRGTILASSSRTIEDAEKVRKELEKIRNLENYFSRKQFDLCFDCVGDEGPECEVPDDFVW